MGGSLSFPGGELVFASFRGLFIDLSGYIHLPGQSEVDKVRHINSLSLCLPSGGLRTAGPTGRRSATLDSPLENGLFNH